MVYPEIRLMILPPLVLFELISDLSFKVIKLYRRWHAENELCIDLIKVTQQKYYQIP